MPRLRRARPAETQSVDLRWWASERPHEAVFSICERIGRHARARRQQDLYYACLYDDAELAGLVQGQNAIASFTPQTMTTNIVRRQVDTFVAKMVKNRPVPMALTTGGNYAQQRRAKSLTKLFEGVLDSVDYWKGRTMRLRDGAIFGSGFAHNYRVGQKLVHERVFPWEIRVDPREARYGKPRSFYVRHFVDRSVLKGRYPGHDKIIDDSDGRAPEDAWDWTWDETSDMVLVEEAWHLPSTDPDTGKKKTDGKHGVFVSGGTLAIGDYLRDYPPFSKFDFSPPLIGWFGEGLVRQLAGLQFELNAVGLRLQENGYLTGTYVWTPDNGGIETDTLDNGTLSIVRSATEPKFMTPSPWHPQFFDYYLKMRTQFAADITGLSPSMTRNEKPAGLESGKALRVYHDIEAENLITQGRADEQDAIDTAWQLFDLMEEIHEETGSKKSPDAYVVKAEKRSYGRSAIEDIKYADVRMDREQFTLRTFPTSFLASTPEDRWSQVSEMAKAGLFSQDEIVSLLDFPDLQRVLDLRTGPRAIVEKICESILEGKKAPYPEATMNLDLCVAIGTLEYLQAKWIDDAPEERTAALLQWVVMCRNKRDGNPDAGVEGTGGPQPGDQSPGAPPPGAGPPPGPPPMMAPGAGPPGAPPMIPPAGQPPPAGAVTPAVLPPVPPA